jgi:hypothetical protein
MRRRTNTKTVLGFVTVISAAVALMPLLVETGPATADVVPVARPASQALELTALRWADFALAARKR